MFFSSDERRARLAVRHGLAPGTRATTAVGAARSVLALHATDPATVFLSVAARTDGVGVAAIERELYDEQALVRMIAMRRTMFVVPADVAPVVQAAATLRVAGAERRRYEKLIAAAGLGDGAWLAEVEEATLVALDALGGAATGAQLSAAEPRLRSKVLVSPGKAYEANQSITTWVLLLLAADGRITRHRPRGSWTSTTYEWVRAGDRLTGELDVAGARTELLRRWLRTFGPAPIEDLKWWTGWGARDVRAALVGLEVVECETEDGPALVLADDVEKTPDPGPWVALLPALDPTVMGWKQRDWYLGAHQPRLFDTYGNAGPSVWSDGRIVGGWAQRPDGEVVVGLLEDVGAQASQAIDAEAARLQTWIGPVRVIPRFRTPLERELTAEV